MRKSHLTNSNKGSSSQAIGKSSSHTVNKTNVKKISAKEQQRKHTILDEYGMEDNDEDCNLVIEKSPAKNTRSQSKKKDKNDSSDSEDEDLNFPGKSNNTISDLEMIFEMTQLEEQNKKYELTADQIADLKAVDKQIHTIIDFVVYDYKNFEWTTVKAKQRRISTVHLPKSFDIASDKALLAQYTELYEKKNGEYRMPDAPFPAAESVQGVFKYCGCDLLSCAKNAAASTHYCGHCLKPLLAFCMVEMGQTFGCCRECYFEYYVTAPPKIVSVAI
jgi:hypothetical protein